MKRLEKLVWKVHVAAVANDKDGIPTLAVVTHTHGHDHVEGIPIPASAWETRDPADIISSLGIRPHDGPTLDELVGLIFTGEAWLVETSGKPDAEVDRLMRQAGNRRLYTEPERISIRTTVGVGPDDEFYQLIQKDSDDFVTDVVAEAAHPGEQTTEWVMQQLRSSAIPAALRNFMGRLEAALDLKGE